MVSRRKKKKKTALAIPPAAKNEKVPALPNLSNIELVETVRMTTPPQIVAVPIERPSSHATAPR